LKCNTIIAQENNKIGRVLTSAHIQSTTFEIVQNYVAAVLEMLHININEICATEPCFNNQDWNLCRKNSNNNFELVMLRKLGF